MTTITIQQDGNPESPRSWDNVGTMITFHGRYDLGDKDHGFNHEDYASWEDMGAAIAKQYGKGCIILPLYLYDHSGITMNTTGFHCRWDSGQVGFIVASAETIRKNFMVKRITAKVRERAAASLVGEVETFDQYIRGDVFGFIVKDDDGKVTDSCWGFYGTDPMENGMSDHFTADQHDMLREAAK